MEATEHYFSAVLFIKLQVVALMVSSADEKLTNNLMPSEMNVIYTRPYFNSCDAV